MPDRNDQPEPSTVASEQGRRALPSRKEPVSPLPARGPLPLRFGDQVFCALTSAIAIAFMGAYCIKTSRMGSEPIEIDQQRERALEYKIDLNEANWVEWSQLPGIGPELARRIVHDRSVNGPFRNIEDLDRVPGIGGQRIQAMRPFVKVAQDDER